MIGISHRAGSMKDHVSSGEVADVLLREVKTLCDNHGLAVSAINPFAGPDLRD